MSNLQQIAGWFGALGLITVAPLAAAQDSGAPALVEQLARCLAIKADAERLACHDRAARALVDASRTREVVVVDKEEVRKTRRSLFGFALPKVKLFGNDGPDQGGDAMDRIEAKITGVRNIGYGKYRLTLDDGAVWSTTEAWRGAIMPEAGDTLYIKRASLGSYLVEIKGGRSIRAVRSQ